MKKVALLLAVLASSSLPVFANSAACKIIICSQVATGSPTDPQSHLDASFRALSALQVAGEVSAFPDWQAVAGATLANYLDQRQALTLQGKPLDGLIADTQRALDLLFSSLLNPPPAPKAGCAMDPNGKPAPCSGAQPLLIGDCCYGNDPAGCPVISGFSKVICGFPLCASGTLSCLYGN